MKLVPPQLPLAKVALPNNLGWSGPVTITLRLGSPDGALLPVEFPNVSPSEDGDYVIDGGRVLQSIAAKGGLFTSFSDYAVWLANTNGGSEFTSKKVTINFEAFLTFGTSPPIAADGAGKIELEVKKL